MSVCATQAGLDMLSDPLELVARIGHKGIMHRHVKRLEVVSQVEQLDPAIRCPRGYTCSTVRCFCSAATAAAVVGSAAAPGGLLPVWLHLLRTA